MKTSSLILIVTTAFVFSLCAVCTGKTITVNVAGGADFTSIQAAIADAGTVTGDEIQVAPGTYTEAIDFLGKAIRLYSSGGQDETTIDGTGHYHVVQCVSGEGAGTILEGFTVTGGNANGLNFPLNCGGGMSNFSSSPTVTDCTFSDNSATDSGGGMSNYGSSNPTVTHCTFSGNSATSHGGGMSNYYGDSPTVTDCTFSDNTANFLGGGISNFYSSTTVTGCTFSDNTAFRGGGMDNSASNPAVINCFFSGNEADHDGGGVYNESSSPTVTDCTFSQNTANYYGGGMYNGYSSSPIVTNCILWGNTSDEIYNNSSTPVVTYCDVQGGYPGTGNIDADPNFVDAASDDLRLSSGSPCIDVGNNFNIPAGITRDLAGDPRMVDGDYDTVKTVDMGAYEFFLPLVQNVTKNKFYPTIQSAIDEADDGDQIEAAPGIYYEAINFVGKAVRLYSSGGPEVTTIDGGSGPITSLLENFNDGNYTGWQKIDQGDTDTSSWSAASGTLVQSGNMYDAPIANNPKILGTYAWWTGGSSWTDYEVNLTMRSTDNDAMGVMFRYQNSNTYYRFGWYNQDQSQGIQNMHLVKFAGGVFTPLAQQDEPYVVGREYQVKIMAIGNSLQVYIDGVLELSASDSTLTNGSIALYCWGNAGTYFDNIEVKRSAYHVVQCVSGEGSDTILDGFTITGGNADGTNLDSIGGGMYNCCGSSPTVTNCTFSDNTAYDGGGMYNYDYSFPTVTNCTFSGNTANFSGSGMYNDYDSSPAVSNCTFSQNTSVLGGGMFNGNSSPAVSNCTFSGNYTHDAGGGMYNDGGFPTVTDCTFSQNAADFGGGIYNNSSSPTVAHCTFSDNTAGYGGGINNLGGNLTVINCTFSQNTGNHYGGGMLNLGSSPNITNSIFWGDNLEISDNSGTSVVSYCDVQGGYAGTGNININPLFVNAADGDLRLMPDSPCIDAGNNAAVLSGVFKDLAGKYRFADDPLTADTGTAATTGRPVVDMGAYEYQGPATTSQNLLANGGFETGDARGWITNWGWNLSAATAQVHTGTHSGLASNRTASWHGVWQSVLGLMDDDKTYRISGWVRLQNADGNNVSLTVKKTDSSGTHYYPIDNATAYDDQWVYLDGTLAVDIAVQPTELYIYFDGLAPGINFYVDDVSVTEVKSDLNHDDHVDLIDFGLLAACYGLDCTAEDCGRANLEDYDSTIDTLDLAVLIAEWFIGVQ